MPEGLKWKATGKDTQRQKSEDGRFLIRPATGVELVRLDDDGKEAEIIPAKNVTDAKARATAYPA